MNRREKKELERYASSCNIDELYKLGSTNAALAMNTE